MVRISKFICRTLITALLYGGLTATVVAVSAPVASAQTSKKATKKASTKKTSTKKSNAKKPATTAAPRKSGDVRKEKQRTEKEIAETRRKISDTQKRITSQLNQLSNIDSQIERQETTIGELNNTIAELDRQTDLLTDSVTRLLKQDSILCKQVARSLRMRHVYRKHITPLAFVTGSANIPEALKRINYLTAMERAESRQVSRLRDNRQRIESTKTQLDSVKANHQAAVKQLATARTILDTRRQQSQKVVNSLRSESESLNKVLKEKQKKIKQLDDELNRIIAEEQRRAKEAEAKKQQSSGGKTSTPGKSTGSTQKGAQGIAEADRTLTGTFAANKGKLLFPVAGKYSITGTFGRSQHEQLSHVQVDNSGIDISVPSGTKARSSFEGTISSIFFMDGYENIIIVRHGEYLTVYAGLSSINVKKGEKVKSGQTLGTIATVDGSTILHFEVRKERSKLNPLQWVK